MQSDLGAIGCAVAPIWGAINGFFTTRAETSCLRRQIEPVALRFPIVPVTVAKMNRAAAWSVRGVGRETRDVAQEAARRAGMSLGEWLDEVIADQAAEQGVDPDDFDEDERLDAIGDRLSGLSRRDEPRAWRSRRDGAEERENIRPRARPRPAGPDETSRAEELLDTAISRFESRAAKSDARTARALDSVATLIERSQSGRRDEREALQAVVGRLESLEERIARQQVERGEAARRPAARAEDGAREIDERMIELSLRAGAPDRGRAVRRARPRIDINEAVSQIANRRQELDAHTANGEAEPAKRGWRNFGVETPPPQRPMEATTEPPARQAAAPPPREMIDPGVAHESAATALQIEIRKLSQRLDEMRREQNERRETPLANIEALRAELAAMSRSLADLAPRNAVVALEGAIRDLSQRVAASREDGARDNMLAPVEGLVAGLRESLRAHDPSEAVGSLQREIGAIGARIDGIAEASIDPLAFERIRQQIEETRNMLGALAQRPLPLDRLERQIGELADRVDRLASSSAPHQESAQVVASLAEARAQVERSTSASALTSIERRLEQIASRIDQALERPPTGSALNAGALEDLSRRIDGVRASIETHHSMPVGAPLDSGLLEQTLREISAKLDRPIAAGVDPSALQSMIQDLGARIDRRLSPVVDTAPLEQVLRKLGERPDSLDTRPLEGLMREISAKLDRPSPPAMDTVAVESMIHDLGARIDRRPNPVVDTAPLEQVLRKLGERPDPLDTRPLEGLMREISAKLDRPLPAAMDTAAVESMIHDLGARIDRLDPVIDTRPIEQTLRALHDKIDQGASPQVAVDRIDQAFEALSAQIASKAGASDSGALERMAAQLLAQLDETRRALRDAPAPPVHPASFDDAFVRSLADLRAEQSNADRRIQSALGGVHDVLETLVDRIGQIEEEVARAAPAPQTASPAAASSAPASAALNAMDATIREAPAFAPPRAAPEPRIDVSPDSRMPHLPPATPMRSIDGSEFLIEPGSGAPLRTLDSDAVAGPNPKSAVNAHIAAARRAAQAAIAETANKIAKDGARPSPDAAGGAGGIEQAKAFLAARRRPILLGVALVALLAIAFVELGVIRQPNMQKSEIEPVTGATLANMAANDENIAAAPAKNDARAVDPTPVGSISAAPTSEPTTKFLTPAPADLVASIPTAAPQGLRDAAAAGDPAAQFELAARFADGRNLPRDPHAAFLWLDRAAAQGFAPAQYRLGSAYEKGAGVARDISLAKAWYKKAADAGNARAMHNLAVLVAEGAGIKPDYSEAANWFQKAAQLGVKDSQFNLAILYARGMGLAQDLNQSWLWFSLAAQQGDLDAAKKRDEVAAKLDAKALAADALALAAFHATTPIPAANDVAAPPGGWDAGKMIAPQTTPGQPARPQATNLPPRAARAAATPM
jgi:localization factor PodJL